MCEVTVVVAPAHADAISSRIESHQWHEHRVQLARCAQSTTHRFQNAERSASYGSGPVVEAHAVVARTDDARQGDAAATPPGQCQQRRGVDFFRGGQVQTDAPAWSQQARGINAPGQRSSRSQTFGTLDGAASGAQFAPQCLAIVAAHWIRDLHTEGRSATRLCRCGPLLSNRSNKVGLANGR